MRGYNKRPQNGYGAFWLFMVDQAPHGLKEGLAQFITRMKMFVVRPGFTSLMHPNSIIANSPRRRPFHRPADIRQTSPTFGI